MIMRRRYGFIGRLLGLEPKSYVLDCADCGHHEHLLVWKRFSDEPYAEGCIGVRTVKKLPERCPKCGGDKLKKSNGPPLIC